MAGTAAARSDDEDDDGGPVRRCLATGRRLPKEALVRFVVDPDGVVVADVAERLPGRGFWLSAGRDVINTACAKGLFAKAARRHVTVAADLAEKVEGLLERRCLDLIGLAMRAGQAVAGFEKAAAWLVEGKGGLLLAARDGAPGGRAKMRALARDLPVVDLFDARDLGRALGREHAVHAVLAPGRLAEAVRREAVRLEGFRRAEDEDPALRPGPLLNG